MGPFGSNIKAECYTETGVPYLNGRNVSSFELIEDEFHFVSEEKADSLGRAVATRGDVIVTHRGTIGQIAYIPMSSKYPRYLTGNSQFRFSCNDMVLPEYIVYYFHTPIGQHELLSNASQVGVPALARPTSSFQKLTVYIPDIATQRRIVEIIQGIERRIKNNVRINDNLQQQAFAQFDRIISQSASELCSLGDIAELNPKRQLAKGTIARCIDMAQLSTSGTFPAGWEMKPYNGGMRFSNGDTIIARITPCLENGKTAFIDFLDDTEVAFGSTEYIVIASLGIYPAEFFYCLARYPSFVDYAVKNMNGSSGRQRVSADTLGKYLLPRLTREEIAAFSETVPAMFQAMRNNSLVNLRLATMRDALLPKLMSGEIDVSSITL